MKHFAAIFSLLLATSLFVGCEKFELEDHCPEDEQNSTSYGDPQDYRVNDDSDSEESGSHAKSFNAAGSIELDEAQQTMGSTGDSSDGSDDSDDDDLINDDSDNEDEGGQPRKPSGSEGSTGGNNNGTK
jgi:hypothetical protein